MFFEIQWVEVGSKNGAKIHQKIDAKMEGMSASIFNGFQWIWVSKKGGKIEPTPIEKGIEKIIDFWIDF